MPRHVVLLRGVNLVRTNRVPMPALRQALEDDGFEEVKTYVQSGNVVLSSQEPSERVEQRVRGLLKKAFGLDIAVVVRSHRELKLVVKRNPLAKVATNPKRYLVTFLSTRPPGEVMEKLKKVAGPEERFVVVGKEIYAWFPEGVGRSPLWERLGAKSLGVTATSRNWDTVTTLLAMSDEPGDR
jgi:uncharacterized protein (DUF1697 family)